MLLLKLVPCLLLLLLLPSEADLLLTLQRRHVVSVERLGGLYLKLVPLLLLLLLELLALVEVLPLLLLVEE